MDHSEEKRSPANPAATQAFPERAFLHSLSTPLSTLGLQIDSLIETMESQGNSSQDHILALHKMRDVTAKIFKLVQDRRQEINNPPSS